MPAYRVPRTECATSEYMANVTQWHLAGSNLRHYSDVIMGMMASKITSLGIVYSTVYSGADQRKHQSSASLAFVKEFTGDRWIPQRGKCFVLMTSSWERLKISILDMGVKITDLRLQLHHPGTSDLATDAHNMSRYLFCKDLRKDVL